MKRDGSGAVANLRAMAAELERQFAGYKQRLAERNGHDVDDLSPARDDDASGGVGEDAEPGGGDSADARGRMYKAYVRRRDERKRQGWRAHMERKEAEAKAFWAQLELTGGRAGGDSGKALAGGGLTTDDAGTAAGDGEGKTERDGDDDAHKKQTPDAALAPRRISGKKHVRTVSFSSSTTYVINSPDVGRRRALSQEPTPSEPPQAVAGHASREPRARLAGGSPTAKTATARPKISLRRKSSVKGYGSSKQQTGGPRLQPRSLPRRASSGGLVDDLGEDVVLPSANAAAPVPNGRSYEQDVHGETPKDSPPRPSVGGGTDAASAQNPSPDLDRSDVVAAVPDGEPEVKSADVKDRGGEEVVFSSPKKLGNASGEITSDSDIERSYVDINKDIIVQLQEQALSLPETQAASIAVLHPEFSVKNNEDNAEPTTPAAGNSATVIATTNAEEAPARASSGESSFSGSGRLGRSPTSSAAPSCSSRDQSTDRVLEADAALLRKKRESRAERSALKPSTPGSAGSRVSGTARSPKDTPRGFRRFLSFGKKNRAREVAAIDCKSPSVSSVAKDDSGGWRSLVPSSPGCAPRMLPLTATDHGLTSSPRSCSLRSLVAASPAKSDLVEIVSQVKSPKAHRSFFSFRALNCGRG